MNIKEVSKALGLPASTILYYEKRGLIKPERKANRYRTYCEDDLRRLKMIYLMREFHFSIEEIEQILYWNQKDVNFTEHTEDAKTFFQTKKQELKKQISFLTKTIEIIDKLPLFSDNSLAGERKYNVISELTNDLFTEYQEEKNEDSDYKRQSSKKRSDCKDINPN